MTTMEIKTEWSPEKSATPEIQTICNEVMSALEGKLGKNFVITAISFIQLSLCGGTHYVIKVYVSERDEYMLVMVNRIIAKTSDLKVCGYQLSAPIRPFVSM